jgi:hypothetical protein
MAKLVRQNTDKIQIVFQDEALPDPLACTGIITTALKGV